MAETPNAPETSAAQNAPAANTTVAPANTPTSNGDKLTPDELEQKNKVGYSLDEEERPERVEDTQVEEEAEKGHS
jgi:hypothetical protein